MSAASEGFLFSLSLASSSLQPGIPPAASFFQLRPAGRPPAHPCSQHHSTDAISTCSLPLSYLQPSAPLPATLPHHVLTLPPLICHRSASSFLLRTAAHPPPAVSFVPSTDKQRHGHHRLTPASTSSPIVACLQDVILLHELLWPECLRAPLAELEPLLLLHPHRTRTEQPAHTSASACTAQIGAALSQQQLLPDAHHTGSDRAHTTTSPPADSSSF